jgi:hypothetical protein
MESIIPPKAPEGFVSHTDKGGLISPIAHFSIGVPELEGGIKVNLSSSILNAKNFYLTFPYSPSPGRLFIDVHGAGASVLNAFLAPQRRYAFELPLPKSGLPYYKARPKVLISPHVVDVSAPLSQKENRLHGVMTVKIDLENTTKLRKFVFFDVEYDPSIGSAKSVKTHVLNIDENLDHPRLEWNREGNRFALYDSNKLYLFAIDWDGLVYANEYSREKLTELLKEAGHEMTANDKITEVLFSSYNPHKICIKLQLSDHSEKYYIVTLPTGHFLPTEKEDLLSIFKF